MSLNNNGQHEAALDGFIDCVAQFLVFSCPDRGSGWGLIVDGVGGNHRIAALEVLAASQGWLWRAHVEYQLYLISIIMIARSNPTAPLRDVVLLPSYWVTPPTMDPSPRRSRGERAG